MIRLRQLRLDRGLSISDLARETGVSYRAIKRLEDSGVEGHATTLQRLAEFFAVPASALLMPAFGPEQVA